MDSLNKAVMEQAKNRQFDEMRKTREYQRKLMDQYNIDQDQNIMGVPYPKIL